MIDPELPYGPNGKKPRGFPKGQPQTRLMKDHVRLNVRLARDCYEYLQFLVENGNVLGLTAGIEMCIRGDREAQRKRRKLDKHE